MKYLRRHIRFPEEDVTDDDPMSGVVNLFDIALVFIVSLLLLVFSALGMREMLDADSSFSLVKKNADGSLEFITKKGRKIEARQMSRNQAAGRGQKLGIAYQLEDGTMIYVPEDDE